MARDDKQRQFEFDEEARRERLNAIIYEMEVSVEKLDAALSSAKRALDEFRKEYGGSYPEQKKDDLG